MFRVLALYVVAAWIVIQVADLAFPGIGVPEPAIRFVWIGAIIGFPLAVAVGWLFDIEDGRIVRTADRSGAAHAALRRSDYLLLSIFAFSTFAITAGLVSQILETRTEIDNVAEHTGVDPKSIAVLPFTNLTGDDSNEPFTLGIHDDVLTHISKISDIKVISRTSVARLDPSMTIREIGRMLGVATVLESGVQRRGNRIRINAQLIDAMTDQHLWADTYDREMTTRSIFDIQTEIAAAITDQLRATLSPQDESNLGKLPTGNLEAYEAYMLGKQRMALRNLRNLEAAIDYFEEAIQLDSDYAVAHVGLANAHMLMNNYGYTPLDPALEVAIPAIEAALALDPQLGAAYAARGLAEVRLGAFDSAEVAYKRAIELDPNHATAFHWYGDVLMSRMSRPGPALPLLERARELDPLSPIINVTLGEVHDALGNFDASLPLYQKAIEIEPDYAGGYYLVGMYERTVRGRLDEAIRWHFKETTISPERETSVIAWNYLDMGDVERARFWIDKAHELYPGGFLPTSASAALYRYLGEETESVRLARQLMDSAPGNNTSLVTLVNFGRYQEVLREIVPLYPELSCGDEPAVSRSNLFPAINLSLVHEDTGNQECAAKLLTAVLERMESMPRRGLRGYGFADVEVLARLGREREALDTLREAIDEGLRHGWWIQGPSSPHMRSLLDNSEYQALLDEIRADMAGQLENVRRLEASGELGGL